MAGQTIFEFIHTAHAVKVSAIDVDTGTEVSIMGPRTASQTALETTAKAKLDWVMKKKDRQIGKTV